MSAAPISLMIADDHLLFIDGLRSLLSPEKDIEIVGIANNGKSLLSLVQSKTPDIILLDINMPQLTGLDALKFISRSYPAIRIIILSTYSETHFIKKAKEYGAKGYLLKNVTRDELLNALALVRSGQEYFPACKIKRNSELNGHDSFLRSYGLTKRELEIIQLVKDNYSNQQIADALFLSIYTVETHRKNLMHKLGLKQPAALMKFIVENGL